ncbi:MAG TPA: SBBP repeat-containing protein, partial [Blastocatellia bacterium]|nr:SBBP repeat-containing protein [Blastocatellia bacterium]
MTPLRKGLAQGAALSSTIFHSLSRLTPRRAVWAAAITLTLILAAGLSPRLSLFNGTSRLQNQTQATSLPADSAPADQRTRARVADSFSKLPLNFIENRGQMDERVAYYVQGHDKTVYFTNQGLTFALNKKSEIGAEMRPEAKLQPASFSPQSTIRNPQSEITPNERYVLKLDFVGARADVRPEGRGQDGATFSYFRGPRSQWNAGVKSYSQIVYRNLWPGIDLVYDGTVNRMKYSFVVKPGADPNQIKLAWRGASDVKLNAAGELEVKTPMGGFNDDRPVSWQEADGRQIDVKTTYQIEPGQEDQSAITYGFAVGEYDRSRELIIDPAMLVYCGYIGGSLIDRLSSIAVDSAGNAYVLGSTQSSETNFPATVGPDTTFNTGNFDAFVAKINAAGTTLVYCGYIGGSSSDDGYNANGGN